MRRDTTGLFPILEPTPGQAARTPQTPAGSHPLSGRPLPSSHDAPCLTPRVVNHSHDTPLHGASLTPRGCLPRRPAFRVFQERLSHATTHNGR